MIKKIIPALYVNVSDVQGDISFKIYRDKDRTDEITGDLVTVCEAFEQNGADAIILFCNAGTEALIYLFMLVEQLTDLKMLRSTFTQELPRQSLRKTALIS